MQRPGDYLWYDRIKKTKFVLTGVAQWTESQPASCEVAGWIPGQGSCLG